jgi:adenylate kinase family enzyme
MEYTNEHKGAWVMVKIHIIGPVGSGKSTLAKQLAKNLDIPYFEIDNIVWERSPYGDTRRSDEEIGQRIANILKLDNWVIEGAHAHSWVKPIINNANKIVYYEPSKNVRLYRIHKRFVKQLLRIEKANYEPSFKMLKNMYEWTNKHETSWKFNNEKFLEPHKEKLIHIKNRKELLDFLQIVK